MFLQIVNPQILSLHFFVILLILLLAVLTSILALGLFYLLSPSPSNQDLVNQITFSQIDTSFGNGVAADQVWDTNSILTGKSAVLAKLQGLRTFLALAAWVRPPSPAISNPTLPYYFTLTEPAQSIKTYIASQRGITYPGSNNTLVGFLITPIHVGLKFAQDNIVSNIIFTGSDITVGTLQELGIVIIYSVS